MRPLEATCKCDVAPLPAIFALQGTGVYISSSYKSNEASDIEALINDFLGQRSVLRVLNIDPYDGYVRLG